MAAVIGLGVVGNAVYKSFKLKEINVYGYDKYKHGGIGTIHDTLKYTYIFLALPTPYDDALKEYRKDTLHEVCAELNNKHYSGTIVIKSTVEPNTTSLLSTIYNNLHFVHNPEFLTARNALEDFDQQKHIVLGQGPSCPKEKILSLRDFYEQYYPEAKISLCDSLESESMKIFCNSFYAVKIQFLTELYLLCQKNGSNFEQIKELMISNGSINSNYTQVPGPDGELSYGGLCFPKDTNSLNSYMQRLDVTHKILESTIVERNTLRKDHSNCNYSSFE